MAKKPRSQRRKKGTSMEGSSEEVPTAAEYLSEEHTIADTVSVFSSNFGDDEEQSWGKISASRT